MVKSQPPAYYRLMLGDFEVTALLDGPSPCRSGVCSTASATRSCEHDLAHAFLKETYAVLVNAFLVNTGTKLVLIDSGDGGRMSAGTGRLIANLKAAGYEPGAGR